MADVGERRYVTNQSDELTGEVPGHSLDVAYYPLGERVVLDERFDALGKRSLHRLDGVLERLLIGLHLLLGVARIVPSNTLDAV